MVAPFNPNQSKITKKHQLFYPRDLGRGNCLDSVNAVKSVSWSSGQVLLNGAPFFALAEQPAVLDISIDSADRPVICWQSQAGTGFVRFFDPVPNSYSTFNCGQLSSPAIHNDYKLTNLDICLVYLIDNDVFYRAHSEKFTVARQLGTVKLRDIYAFGIGYFGETLEVGKLSQQLGIIGYVI